MPKFPERMFVRFDYEANGSPYIVPEKTLLDAAPAPAEGVRSVAVYGLKQVLRVRSKTVAKRA